MKQAVDPCVIEALCSDTIVELTELCSHVFDILDSRLLNVFVLTKIFDRGIEC